MDNSFFSRFTPKEPKYFPLLDKLAETVLTASHLLVDFVEKKRNNEDISDSYKLIKEQEREGDKITQTIFDALSSTFITPFDREDIHTLTNKLDDVLDVINSCAKRIDIYNPKSLPNEAFTMAHLITKGAEDLQKCIRQLHNLKKNSNSILALCEELHILENKGDDIYEDFIRYLFERASDTVEIIKLKNIMEELEKITDAEEHTGKVLKTIIVKHA
jgi:predicted phosphate transport protein (TIGR00153 family)